MKSSPKPIRKKQPHILITNDDGIDAPGLKALADALSKVGRVSVVAPDRERSTSGRALTLHKPLRVYQLPRWKSAATVWKTTGTPSDCVKLARQVILKNDDPIDIVVSGINRGANLGSDILYSGTAAAAFEAGMSDIPAIAVSLVTKNPQADFRKAASFTAEFVSKWDELKIPPETIININYPGRPNLKIRGVRWTKLGVRKYIDIVDQRSDPKGNIYYWLSGEPKDDHTHTSDDIDIRAVRNGWISVTPVKVSLTDFDTLERLSTLKLSWRKR